MSRTPPRAPVLQFALMLIFVGVVCWSLLGPLWPWIVGAGLLLLLGWFVVRVASMFDDM